MCFSITHAYDGDLDVVLVSPSGLRVERFTGGVGRKAAFVAPEQGPQLRATTK